MSCLTERPAEVCIRRTADILGDSSGRGSISWSERNGQTDVQEASENRKERRRQAARCEANPNVSAQFEGFSTPDKLASWSDERSIAVPQRGTTRSSD
jgi:hypothetical protein